MGNLERMPTTNQKTVGEALGVKKRNPIESVFYKRKVTMAERWGGKKTEERKKTPKEEDPMGEALKMGGNPW